MRRLLVLLLIGVLGVAGCTSRHTASPAPSATPSARALAVTHPTLWLCSPAQTHDPCDVPLASSAVHPDGTTTREPAPPVRQPVDCFYVYPTVSEAQTRNAPLRVAAAEERTATAQAAPFSSVCRVFAPVYRQLTVHALLSGDFTSAEGRALAHADVVSAWHDYLNHNPGRRFVLIGHSQGSFELLALLQQEIDGKPALQRRLVSALLLGGNVKVPPGAVVGGDLQQVPLCTSPTQSGCVVTYNTYDTTPPDNTLFGRPDPARGLVAACTNPAALQGGSGALLPVFPAGPQTTGLLHAPRVSTGFLSYPGYVTAACRTGDGRAWLQVSTHPIRGDTRPRALPKTLGPAWGLHLVDVSIALGNLVDLVRTQSGGQPRT